MLRKTKSRSLSGKHLKTTLLVFALLFSVNALMAQEKYEYSMVQYHTRQGHILHFAEGKEVKIIEVDKEIVDRVYNSLNPGIAEVNKLSSEGWEVINSDCVSTTSGLLYNFYLRRKEQ